MFKIVTVADSKYFNLAKVMLKSASIHFPEASAYIELVNTERGSVNILKKNHSNLIIQEKSIDFKNNNQKKCYCTNRRGQLLFDLRKLFPDDILIWCDADILFRKPCSEFAYTIKNYDLSASRKPNGGTIRAALFSVGVSTIASEFLYHYSKAVNMENKWEEVIGDSIKALRKPKNWKIWMTNQHQLTEVYDKYFFSRLKFKNLDSKYCDVTLNDKSVVWNGLSKNKSKSLWIKEQEIYK